MMSKPTEFAMGRYHWSKRSQDSSLSRILKLPTSTLRISTRIMIERRMMGMTLKARLNLARLSNLS
jgi:hypothetical protein